MDLRQEIVRKIDSLPPDLQSHVLGFVSSLSASAPLGEKGSALCRFSESLDATSALEMTQAIEEECERVEAGKW